MTGSSRDRQQSNAVGLQRALRRKREIHTWLDLTREPRDGANELCGGSACGAAGTSALRRDIAVQRASVKLAVFIQVLRIPP